MSSTPISPLDCTHLYEKFAVRERYRSVFTGTYLVCASEVSPPHHQLHGSSQYTTVRIYAVLAPIHSTYEEYDVIIGHVQSTGHQEEEHLRIDC